MGVEAQVREVFALRIGGAGSGMEAEKPGGTWWTGEDSSEGVRYEDAFKGCTREAEINY